MSIPRRQAGRFISTASSRRCGRRETDKPRSPSSRIRRGKGMWHTACRLVALGSFLALLSIADDRPRYGGTLRLAMTDARAKEMLSPLVFERLVDFDGGRAKPTLAVSWVHNTPWTRWR